MQIVSMILPVIVLMIVLMIALMIVPATVPMILPVILPVIVLMILPAIVPATVPVTAPDRMKKDRTSSSDIRPSILKAAATYSPTWWGSTIGASELNFSVRYGKRWILTAIAAAVYVWKQITDNDFFCQSPSNSLVKGIGNARSSRDISTGRLCHH